MLVTFNIQNGSVSLKFDLLRTKTQRVMSQNEKEKVVINAGIKSTLVEMDLKMLLI